MAYEIKIYGEIISQHLKDSGTKGFTLSDLQGQLAKAEGQDIKVRFNSPGGDCGEGFAMYDELRRYAVENNAKIHTYAESYLASIVTVPFLAGDVREISRTIEPFIHNAQWGLEGDSRDFQKGAEELEKWNEKIARHYSEHTELSYEEARELMNNDTSITAREAEKMKFATKIEYVPKPVALQRFTNPNNNKMTKEKSILAKGVHALLKSLGITNKIVKTADLLEVDFYELEEDEPIEVGANATIDGAPAEGEVVMADGETYVFAAGVLTEIRPKEDEPAADDSEEVEALKAKIAELEATNLSLTAKMEEKAVSNKALRTALNNVVKLQSEIVETHAAARPSNKQTAKPTTAAKAVSGLK